MLKLGSLQDPAWGRRDILAFRVPVTCS